MKLNHLPFVSLILVTGFAVTGCQTTTISPNPMATPPNTSLEQTVKQTLIVLYDKKIGDVAIRQKIANYHATITHKYSALYGMAIRFPVGTDMNKALADFRQTKGVTSVSKDQIQTIQ